MFDAPPGADGLFGPYRIDQVLRRDGLGEVYRAIDTRAPDRAIALRLLPEHLCSDDDYRVRFDLEARIGGGVVEPHIIAVHQYGVIDGQLYLTTPLVAGPDLEAVAARGGPLAAEHAVMITDQVAAALDAVHVAGLVHRHVTPATIQLTQTEPTSVRLLDVGLAGDVGAPTAGLEYAAPERFQGGAVDRAADVYALACVLFRLLTGRPPYTGEAPALRQAHLAAPVPFLAEHRPELAEALDPVLARGLAKDPARRYRVAGEFAAAAREALGLADDVVTPVVTAPVVTAPSATVPAATVPAATAPVAPAELRTVVRVPPRAPPIRNALVIVAAIAVVVAIGGVTTILLANRAAQPPADVVAEPEPEPEREPQAAAPPIDLATLKARLLTPAEVGPGFVTGSFTPAPSDARLPCGQPTLVARFALRQVGATFDDGAGNQAIENARLFVDSETAARAFTALREGFGCGQGRSVDGRPGTISAAIDVTDRVGGDQAVLWNLSFADGSRTAIVVVQLGEVLLSWQAAVTVGAAPGAAPDIVGLSTIAAAKIAQGP